MSEIWALFLGAVQGITEVLPISSSAHLILFPWFFNVPDQGLSFDVALHLGSLFAVIFAFREEWVRLIKKALLSIKDGQRSGKGLNIIYFLIFATIPGALAGYFLEDAAERIFRAPLLIVATLVIFAALLWLAEKKGAQKKSFEDISFGDALMVGLAQGLAIIPGTSRSGVTITAGLARGLKKEEAAKFSFMLSAPIIFGAALFKLSDFPSSEFLSAPFILGVTASFIFAVISIRFILKYVKTKSYTPFVIYRLGLAALILLMYYVRARG